MSFKEAKAGEKSRNPEDHVRKQTTSEPGAFGYLLRGLGVMGAGVHV